MTNHSHSQIQTKTSGRQSKMAYDEFRGAYGEEAEKYALNWFRSKGYEAVPTKEWLGNKWSPENDAKYGDIQIFKNDNVTQRIDVKRAGPNEPDTFYGTITKTGASEVFRNDPNAWYLLFNKNITKYIWVKATSLRNSQPRNGKFWTTKEVLPYAEH